VGLSLFERLSHVQMSAVQVRMPVAAMGARAFTAGRSRAAVDGSGNGLQNIGGSGPSLADVYVLN
jgi:hypothetical protein